MSNPLPQEVQDQITNTIISGRKIQAIKVYRDHSGQSLKDAKEFVEALEAELREKEPEKFTTAPGGKGCLVVLLTFGITALGLAGLGTVIIRG